MVQALRDELRADLEADLRQLFRFIWHNEEGCGKTCDAEMKACFARCEAKGKTLCNGNYKSLGDACKSEVKTECEQCRYFSTPQPTPEPTPEPTTAPTGEPTAEPTAEPTPEP